MSEYSVKILSCRAGAGRLRLDKRTNTLPDLRREASKVSVDEQNMEKSTFDMLTKNRMRDKILFA